MARNETRRRKQNWKFQYRKKFEFHHQKLEMQLFLDLQGLSSSQEDDNLSHFSSVFEPWFVRLLSLHLCQKKTSCRSRMQKHTTLSPRKNTKIDSQRLSAKEKERERENLRCLKMIHKFTKTRVYFKTSDPSFDALKTRNLQLNSWVNSSYTIINESRLKLRQRS